MHLHNELSLLFWLLKHPLKIKTGTKKTILWIFFNHQQWNHENSGWNISNNLRLIVSFLLLFLVQLSLQLKYYFQFSNLLLGFSYLISALNNTNPLLG